MKKKEFKKQIEELAQKVAFMSEKMYKLETYLIDLQIKDAKRERNIIPKRTMNDVKVGDTVRYVTPMPEGTWMMKPWAIDDGLKVGYVYPVIELTEIAVTVAKGGKYIDKKCFELING
jgi:hypothetical protein